MGIRALEAAKIACEASDWTISNLQLQKILYIAHMLYSGRNNNNPLIVGDAFQAWEYGPVLPSVYQYVKAFGASPIRNVFRSIGESGDSDEKRALVNSVGQLSKFPPFKLVQVTHDPRGAWAKVYVPNGHCIIPQEYILDEYNTIVKPHDV